MKTPYGKWTSENLFDREQILWESGIASIVNNLRCHASVCTQREKYQSKEKQRIETSLAQIPHPSDIIVNSDFKHFMATNIKPSSLCFPSISIHM